MRSARAALRPNLLSGGEGRNENAARWAAFRDGLLDQPRLLGLIDDPVHGVLDLLVGERRHAALRGHEATIRTVEALDRVLDQGVDAFRDARRPVTLVAQLRRAADAR